MKFVIKALLAATALIPVATAASAQDAPREDGRRWNRGGERGNGGERAERRQAPERPQRVDVDRDASRRGDWNARTDVRTDGARGQARADMGTPFRPVPPPEQSRRDGQRDGSRDYASQRAPQQAFRDDRRGGNDWNRQRGEQWRGDQWRGDQSRGNVGRDNGRRYDDRGQWNRTWRNDNRYDWNRYRTNNRYAYRLPRYYAPSNWGYGYRRFGVGVTLNSILWNQNYWIEDPFNYRLPEAYGPYRWVRYYNDALLVDVRQGRVVDVVHDIFW